MNYKSLILNRLLDRYEKSRHFTEGQSQRRIMLKMVQNDFPEYDIENPLIKETFNSAISELTQKNLTGFDWLRYEEGNIIDKVWLNVSNIEEAYRHLGRKPRRLVLDMLLDQVIAGKKKIAEGWILRYLEDVEHSVKERSSTAGLLPNDREQASALLRALQAIDALQGEQRLERVFSLSCFGDSKYFERNIRAKTIGIIKRYYLGREAAGEMSDDEVLAQVGILKSPEQIDFKGAIVCTIGSKRIDFSIFIHGISINGTTVRDLKVEGMGDVRKILFIENKANYLQFVAENTDDSIMVVFHGGFYSPVKGVFFQKLYDAASPAGVEFFHWGDIDLGGFLIFNKLKTNIIPSLRAYRMDKSSLISRVRYATKFDSRYGEKLKILLRDPEYSEFYEVIEFMLEKAVKLEQEAFLQRAVTRDDVAKLY
ncbi:DUF3322 domain-containing protein [Bacillota bacterium]